MGPTPAQGGVNESRGSRLRPRPAWIAAAGAASFLALWVRDWGGVLTHLSDAGGLLGVDYTLYMTATRRFLGGGPFYEPWQLSGPYGIHPFPVLYPPESIVLLAPFTALPWILWWLIPVGVTAAVIVAHRPRAIVWPLLAACLWWPDTATKLFTGNPVMWCAAFVALGTIWRWPAAFALLKPTLAPFALIGVRDRRWWVAVAIGLLPFAWLLPDYVTALRNFQAPDGLLYSATEIPVLALPLVAWLGRSKPPEPG